MALPLMAKIASVTPLKRGHDFYWEVIRRLTEHDRDALIATRAIAVFADKGRATSIGVYLKELAKAGYLEVTAGPKSKPDSNLRDVYYKVLRRPVETPALKRKHGLSQQAMWNAMTWPLRQGFTVKDLIIAASTEEMQVGLKMAQLYVKNLCDAGVLTLLKTEQYSKKTYRIRPAANTGPKAPRIARLGKTVVFDANTLSIVGGKIELDEAAQ